MHWLRDFLPLHEETSRARVLAYTYNASAAFGAVTRGVVAQVGNLLGWLRLERQVRLAIFLLLINIVS